MNYPIILVRSVLRNKKSYYNSLTIYFVEFLIPTQFRFYFYLSVHNTSKYNILHCICTLNHVLLLM